MQYKTAQPLPKVIIFNRPSTSQMSVVKRNAQKTQCTEDITYKLYRIISVALTCSLNRQ